MPMATAQCRRFLNEKLPSAEVLATNSTADAARLVGQHDPAMAARPTAAIAPRLAATLYGLDILVEDVEDHPDNQTRFVVPGPDGDPLPHRARPDQHRLLPERRPPRQPPRHPRPVLRPQHQLVQAGVEAHQAGSRATTASSSTSRATSPMPWSATACATFTPAWPESNSSARIQPPVQPPPRSVAKPRRRGRRRAPGSTPCGRRSGRREGRPRPAPGRHRWPWASTGTGSHYPCRRSEGWQSGQMRGS